LVEGTLRVIESVVDRAQAQLDAQAAANDALDLKALGVLAANVAGIAVLAAVHESVELWWLPILFFGVGVGFLLAVVWPIDTYAGPSWDLWYARFGALDPTAAGRQMLVDLLAAQTHNSTATRRKGRWFKFGFIGTFVGFGLTVMVAVI
jgi:hypothetical protein